jgi:hypothetical protein
MKTKNLTKPIFSLLLMLGALWWSGCIGDDCPDCPCEPEEARVHYTYLDTQYKEYLPYYILDTLVYDVTYEGKYYGEVTFVKTFEGSQYHTKFDVIGACDSFYDEYHLFTYESKNYPYPFRVYFESFSFSLRNGPYEPNFKVLPVHFRNREIDENRIKDSVMINSKIYYDIYYKDINSDSSIFLYYSNDFGYIQISDSINKSEFKLIKAL